MANTLNLGTDGNWAVKKDSLLAYNSENGNFKPLPFSFSRASSATVVNKDGLIETVGSGKPRIDFRDDAKGALLLEPQRTNSLLQSNQFDTTWVTASATIESGQSGVGGSTDAWKLTTTNTIGYLVQTIGVSGTKTFSIYAKSDTTNGIVLRLLGGSNPYVSWSLVDGSFLGVGGGADLIDKKSTSIGNGWFRLDMTTTVDCTSVRVYNGDSDGNFADGSIYIQYAQLEQGSYATSYIPTQGSAVTRVADACNNAGNNQVINSTEGVLYAEISALADDSSEREITISDGTSNNRLVLKFTGSNIINAFTISSLGATGFSVATATNNPIITQFNKIAVSFNSSNAYLFVNGVLIGSDVITNVLGANLNKISFANASDTNQFFRGNCKDLRVYTTALTDSELIALTTI